MNKLRGSRCYLCGAMDRVKDAGVGWRKMIRQELQMGLNWLDPTRKPINVGLEDDESRKRRKFNKAAGDFEAVRAEMKTIRHVDLRMVDICDFLIVNLDMDVHASGTYEELYLANSQKKPVLVHVEQGKANAPDWLFGTLPDEYIFTDWKDLVNYVRGVAHGNIVDVHDRWGFFDWMGDKPKTTMTVDEILAAIVVLTKMLPKGWEDAK